MSLDFGVHLFVHRILYLRMIFAIGFQLRKFLSRDQYQYPVTGQLSFGNEKIKKSRYPWTRKVFIRADASTNHINGYQSGELTFR